MNPVLEAMNRLLPSYIANEYPELEGWDFKLYDSHMPERDCEVITLIGRRPHTNEMYRNSFTFSRQFITAVGNLSDVYNEGFRKMLYEMHDTIIKKELNNILHPIPALTDLLNTLL